ncbi:MAG TPA: methyltransferase domain-containing protein [Longimicrobiales bacterium]
MDPGIVSRVDYDRLADAYARHRRADGAVLAALAAAVGPTSRVLEVGCGTGNYITALEERVGCRCVGVDPSGEMLKRLRVRNRRVGESAGSAENLPFPNDTFDLVFSVDVIHHVRDRPRAFAEALRVLRAGGLICTATDSEWVIRNRLMAEYFPSIVAVEMGRYPAIDRLRTEMTAAGFSEIREELTETPYQLTDAAPYRERVFSALSLIDEASFASGLSRLEADLAKGPVHGVARYTLLWAVRK